MQHIPANASGTNKVELVATDAQVQSELDTLRRRLAELEGSLPRKQKTAGRSIRNAVAMLIAMAVLTVLANAPLVHGQSVVDALFISAEGNVGIGTTNPINKLDVVGNANFSGNVGIGTTQPGVNLEVSSDGLTQVQVTSIGSDGGWLIGQGANGTLSDPTATVKGDALASFRGRGYSGDGFSGSRAFMNFYASEDWNQNANGAEIGFSTTPNGSAVNGQVERMRISQDGNVGIGTDSPNAKLNINGDVRAGGAENGSHFWIAANEIQQYNGTTPADMYLNWRGGNVVVKGNMSAASVNGEKPPMVFTVGMNTDTTKYWTSGSVDIGPLCGDADGCTIKLLMRVKSTDEVRVIEDTIFIEQPGESGNKTAGLHGWARQQGGGDAPFVLNTAGKYEVIVPNWNWIYARNYTQIANGQLVSDPVLTGYNVTFMTVPDVAATVIIYDR